MHIARVRANRKRTLGSLNSPVAEQFLRTFFGVQSLRKFGHKNRVIENFWGCLKQGLAVVGVTRKILPFLARFYCTESLVSLVRTSRPTKLRQGGSSGSAESATRSN